MIIEISKISVVKSLPKLFIITLNLKLMEGPTELLSSNFTEKYRLEQDIPTVVNRFKNTMQKAIDDYKAEQNLLSNAQLDSAIIDLKNQLAV